MEKRSRQPGLLFLIACAVNVGCGGAGDPAETPDARTSLPDSSIQIPDARTLADSAVNQPDALPIVLDANAPEDSPTSSPDSAANPDASIVDAATVVADASQPDAPTGGSTATVVASLNSDTFVIESIFGLQIFEAKLLCFGVVEGDHVTFSQAHGACVSNTFTDQRTGNSCDVWCPSGTAETGTIVSVSNFDTYVIQLAGGLKTFKAQVACFANLPGHHVVFTDPTSFCFSNTFINLDANNSCDVYCQ